MIFLSTFQIISVVAGSIRIRLFLGSGYLFRQICQSLQILNFNRIHHVSKQLSACVKKSTFFSLTIDLCWLSKMVYHTRCTSQLLCPRGAWENLCGTTWLGWSAVGWVLPKMAPCSSPQTLPSPPAFPALKPDPRHASSSPTHVTSFCPAETRGT